MNTLCCYLYNLWIGDCSVLKSTTFEKIQLPFLLAIRRSFLSQHGVTHLNGYCLLKIGYSVISQERFNCKIRGWLENEHLCMHMPRKLLLRCYHVKQVEIYQWKKGARISLSSCILTFTTHSICIELIGKCFSVCDMIRIQ